MDNANSGVCYICVWMVHIPLKRVCRFPFFLIKYSLLGLTPVSSDTIASASRALHSESKFWNNFSEKLVFTSQKVPVTGYYVIESPLLEVIAKHFLLEG